LFAALPRHEGRRIADLLDDAGLHRGSREHGADRLGKAAELAHNRDQNVADTGGDDF
jgi:hypothetical protein